MIGKVLWASVFGVLLLSGNVVRASSSCSSDLDCSLNGICQNAKNSSATAASSAARVCVCDKPWSGDNCEKLNFQPAKGRKNSGFYHAQNDLDAPTAATAMAPQGYGMDPNVTTWGGGILVERSNDTNTTVYHLYVSRMTNECPLANFQTNSRVDHAVSNSITGPYTFQDVAIPTFSHNPAPVELSTQSNVWKYAIFHIGDGTGKPGKDCRNATTSSTFQANEPLLEGEFLPDAEQKQRNLLRGDDETAMGSTIHVANSLNGPWVPLQGHDLGHCNNVAPWVHPSNGTLYVICSYSGKHSILHKSQDGNVAGPYEVVKDFAPGIPINNIEDTAFEDPSLYTDQRGNFHVIYHAYQYTGTDRECSSTVVSAHTFSRDGFDWHTSPTPPYGSNIAVEGEERPVTLASRERPKVFLGGSPGVITHIVEGVCGSPVCDATLYKPYCVHCKYMEWDFTLVSTLGDDSKE